MNKSFRYYIFYKPYGYLSGFTREGKNPGLGELLDLPKDVYAIGRLDADSEGLLLLSNDKAINQRLLDPLHRHSRSYWVQVEGLITEDAIRELMSGLTIKHNGRPYHTLPCIARMIHAVDIPVRIPPIRIRKSIPTSWLELQLFEGKNRQVRQMTAKTGFPTLRLIRVAIEDIHLGGMKPADIQETDRINFYRDLKL